MMKLLLFLIIFGGANLYYQLVMKEQTSKEFVYFKIPVYVIDLTIHLSVLYWLLKTLPSESLVGLDLKDGIYKGLFAMLAMSFTVSIFMIGLRLHERKIKIRNVLWRAVKQTVLTYLLFTLMLALINKVAPRQLLFQGICFSLPLIAIAHFLVNKLVRQIRKVGHNIRSVVVIGTDEVAHRLYKEMGYGRLFTGYSVKGFFTSNGEETVPEGAKYLGAVDDCYEWLRNNPVEEVYCSLPPALCEKEVNKIVHICNEMFMDFYYLPTMDGYPHRQMAFQNFGKVTVIKLREEPMNTPLAKFGRRLIDLLISGLFLCTLYPFVLLFVWIGNKVTGNEGPLYFRQARTGYNGKSFKIYKFRSMKVNKDADKLQATENDPRKTPFGDFLRRSSIDELPQFINVFLGDMSVIGPRPHMEYHTEMYSELIGNYMVRHLAKPGITGWAQVSGCRGETKTVEEMKARVEHDIWYIEHWTPLLDLEIFFKTIWQVMPGHDKQAY